MRYLSPVSSALALGLALAQPVAATVTVPAATAAEAAPASRDDQTATQPETQDRREIVVVADRIKGQVDAPVSYTHLDVYKRQALLWAHAKMIAPYES